MTFVDSSALIAAAFSRDRNHKPATLAYDQLRLGKAFLVTTYFVFAEVMAFLRRRASSKVAIEAGQNLLKSGQILLVHVAPETHQQAWSIFSRYDDWDLSYTDCVSFAVMEQMNIKTAFTFDSDFERYGFQMTPLPPG